MELVYTVSQINGYIGTMMRHDTKLNNIYVKGEVSECKVQAASGHLYFTIKDGKSKLTCIKFGYKNDRFCARIEVGMSVIVFGSMNVYEPYGTYSLIATEIRADGAGLLYERYNLLKKKLEEEGLFDPCYKREIPAHIKTLGIVTSPTGAAIQDIIRNASLRNPYVQLVLAPAVVQGPDAAPSIVRAIKKLEDYGVDVMIVGRGGGSIEDLWAFNEEEVARAVFDSSVPVISAVGHETDTTICDLVSDLRVSTPTAAAVAAVYDIRAIDEKLATYHSELVRGVLDNLSEKRQRVEWYKNELNHLSPASSLSEKKQKLDHYAFKLNSYMTSILNAYKHKAQMYKQNMSHLSPVGRISGGYGFILDKEGNAVTDVLKENPGDEITILIKNGRIKATITQIEKTDWDV